MKPLKVFEDDQLYKPAEVAERLHISAATVSRLKDRRELASLKVGKSVRIFGWSLNAFVEKNSRAVSR